MKVVLFCGGQGMRLRDFSESLPKPMVPVGRRPILWHLMRYYAHFGHVNFILCLGYKSDLIRAFVDGIRGKISPELIAATDGVDFEFPEESTDDWTIDCVDTGLNSTVGERLRAVRSYVSNEEMFLANYVDGLSDVHLPTVIDSFHDSRKTACFVGVRPQATFHLISAASDGTVHSIEHVRSGNHRINGGFFVLRPGIFDVLQEGDDLVDMPFQRLIKAGQLMTYRHDGFWACMDTFREKQILEDLFASGRAPWMVWK